MNWLGVPALLQPSLTSTSPPFANVDTGSLLQGSRFTSDQLLSQRQDDELHGQAEQKPYQFPENGVLEIPGQTSGHTGSHGRLTNPENQYQYPILEKTNNQQALPEKSTDTLRFVYLPDLFPFCDKDRSMQLDILWTRYREKEITMDTYRRNVKDVVGHEGFGQAGRKLKQILQLQEKIKAQAAETSPTGSHQLQSQSQISSPKQRQVPSVTTSLKPKTNVKTPLKKPSVRQKKPSVHQKKPSIRQKKPSIRQKKPFDVLQTPSSMASKKQKVSGEFLDQSIKQLNDATAICGVNIMEEEEQLFSGHKVQSQALEGIISVVQEEEGRLVFQRVPFDRKLAKIISKCGIKNGSKDAERCLSLCLEVRLQGLIRNSIKASKQRVDIEKSRCQTTSDVRRQMLVMNQKAKEDWEKKQAEEAEKLRNNEAKGNTGVDGEDSDEDCIKKVEITREEYVNWRIRAANTAARIAAGGDDVISKWKLMAEQARQKPKGSIRNCERDLVIRPPNATRTAVGGDHDLSKWQFMDEQARQNREGSIRKCERNLVIRPHTKVLRTISVKDMIAVLERDPQMSKSMLYCLFERIHS